MFLPVNPNPRFLPSGTALLLQLTSLIGIRILTFDKLKTSTFNSLVLFLYGAFPIGSLYIYFGLFNYSPKYAALRAQYDNVQWRQGQGAADDLNLFSKNFSSSELKKQALMYSRTGSFLRFAACCVLFYSGGYVTHNLCRDQEKEELVKMIDTKMIPRWKKRLEKEETHLTFFANQIPSSLKDPEEERMHLERYLEVKNDQNPDLVYPDRSEPNPFDIFRSFGVILTGSSVGFAVANLWGFSEADDLEENLKAFGKLLIVIAAVTGKAFEKHIDKWLTERMGVQTEEAKKKIEQNAELQVVTDRIMKEAAK